jgi:hypothetical protein
MKTDIEYAALVMGRRVVVHDGQGWQINDGGAETGWWRPGHDDGDSRRLEAACMKWVDTHPKRLFRAEVASIRNRMLDGDLQAIRTAVFALAVAIGKTIEDNNNAG